MSKCSTIPTTPSRLVNSGGTSYEKALSRCSTPWAPWYVIPSNLKWFRNWAVAQIIVNTLERMKLKFPEPEIDVSRLVIE
jgi:Polyphosphate kinase 2 (PPK2)